MLVQFVSVVASTTVATAAPTIVADLHGVDLYAWIFGGFTLAATVTVPVVGKLSDLLGRRRFYLGGLVVFLTGSTACAVAQNMPELVAARVIAGLGGGAMLALTGATIGDIFPPRERAKWMGLIMTNYGVGSMLGPIVGGVVTDQFGWRWTFVITLPIAALALGVMAAVMPRTSHTARPRIDWLGIALLTVGLLGVLIALTVGGVSYAWTSPGVLAALGGGLVVLVAFGVHELHEREPIMLPALFRSPVFLSAMGLSFLTRMAFFGLLAFFPVLLQGVRGDSAQAAGLQLLPVMGAFIAGNIISGQAISRTGRYRLNAILGPIVLAIGLCLCLTVTPDSSAVTLYVAMSLVGLGVGTIFPLASTVVQSVFPYRILGTANSGRQFFDNLGQVIGISVMTTITITMFTAELPRRLPASAGILGSGARQTEGLLSSRGQSAIATALARAGSGDAQHVTAALRESLAVGLRGAFAFALLATIAAIVVGAVLPAIPLRTTHEDS
jgi:EmrB/QacA subfamily drug resistance transporter